MKQQLSIGILTWVMRCRRSINNFTMRSSR